MSDQKPIKTRVIDAVLARLAGMANPDVGDLALRTQEGEASFRRGVSVEELMGVYPSAIVLDGAESVDVADSSTRGKVFTFPVLIKLCLGPQNNSDPALVDRFIALAQQVMEQNGDEPASGDGSGYGGLELREADGTVVGYITGGGDAQPFYQGTEGSSVVGAVVRYLVTYRRVFGNPWEKW
jgi:hypothetical protein